MESMYTMVSQKKFRECFDIIMTELTKRYPDGDISFNSQKATITFNKENYDFVWAFVDGMLSMYNIKESWAWLSMDDEWSDDTVTITIELN